MNKGRVAEAVIGKQLDGMLAQERDELRLSLPSLPEGCPLNEGEILELTVRAAVSIRISMMAEWN